MAETYHTLQLSDAGLPLCQLVSQSLDLALSVLRLHGVTHIAGAKLVQLGKIETTKELITANRTSLCPLPLLPQSLNPDSFMCVIHTHLLSPPPPPKHTHLH